MNHEADRLPAAPLVLLVDDDPMILGVLARTLDTACCRSSTRY